jgi:hypothetical protein
VIHTVFCAAATEVGQWQAELLEYSWRRTRQTGELVRLVAVGAGEPLPRHRHARVLGTLPWSPHPYTGDDFPAYNRAASVLEWLFRERIDGTVLLLDPDCILRAPVQMEMRPGQALATPWPELHLSDEEPFGLGPDFAFLHRFCVNRSLAIRPVTLPILIHSHDLRRIAVRWLELTGIIRCERQADLVANADLIAYAIAAAEAEVAHEVGELGMHALAGSNDAPIVSYRDAIRSGRGEIVWDKRTYAPWEKPEPARARPGPGRELLLVLEEFAEQRESGSELRLLHPQRRKGVREARVLDRMLLEIPDRPGSLALNASAAAIWELCDDQRNLAEITGALEARFGASPGSLRRDVESAVDHLESVGALHLHLDGARTS